MNREWFRFNARAEAPNVAELQITDVIGGWVDDWLERNYGGDEGVTARKVVEQLAALPDSISAIRVHINSPGGDVQAGINIANALREQQAKGRTVETIVDGIAASIASVIAMAGSKVTIADNALMMVHDPYMLALGNAEDMRKTAGALDAIKGQIIATYKWHSPLSEEELAALMTAETWLDADQAIEKGLATDKIAGLQAAASIDARAMNFLRVPDQHRARVAAFIAPERPTPAPAVHAASADNIMRRCVDAGLDLTFAASLVDANVSSADLHARIAAEQGARAKERQRVDAIRAACKVANVPMLADGYVAGGMSFDAVKAHLVTIAAVLDSADIDTSLLPYNAAPDGADARGVAWKKVFAHVRAKYYGGNRGDSPNEAGRS